MAMTDRGRSLDGHDESQAQMMDEMCILVDSENALDEAWLQAVGVDTSEEKLLRLGMSMIDDVAKTISNFIKEYLPFHFGFLLILRISGVGFVW